MDEIWRDINGYEGLYQVSNFGRVKSFHNGELILKPGHDKNGYLQVNLRHSGKQVQRKIHRLVAMAFISNPDGKPEVNHIDGDKFNNHVDNLVWVTHTENVRHAAAAGLIKTGEDRYGAKLTNEQACYIRDNSDGLNTVELARQFGVAETTISDIQLGRIYKTAGGRIRGKVERRIPDQICEQIRAEYIFGSHEFGSTALARKYDLGVTTIKQIVREN